MILNEIKTGDRYWIKLDQHPDWIAIRVLELAYTNGIFKIKYLNGKKIGIEELIGLNDEILGTPYASLESFLKLGISKNPLKVKSYFWKYEPSKKEIEIGLEFVTDTFVQERINFNGVKLSPNINLLFEEMKKVSPSISEDILDESFVLGYTHGSKDIINVIKRLLN